jgi:hypothetical protein
MKLAINQPYFFPYLGYFDLINMVDMFIVHDVPQYMRHHWVNRNRVLHPASGWWYVVVALKKHHFTTPLDQIEISQTEDWQKRLFRQLEHYHVDAPYYTDVIKLLKDCFANPEGHLVRFNTRLVRAICEQLDIKTPIHVFSEMDLPIPAVQTITDLAIETSRAVGAIEYINRPGGADLFDEPKFVDNRLKLTIQSFRNMTYPCGRYAFEPGLSILDVMMWNSREDIKEYLDNFRTQEPGNNA